MQNAITQLKNNVKLCTLCFNPFEGIDAVCDICKNPARNQQTLCIIEKEADLLSIENARKYSGLYFVLAGSGTFRKSDIDNLRLQQLKERIAKNQFSEIIIAINPTLEGKTVAYLVEKTIKELNLQNCKISHLAQGLPVGGELEYTDEETLGSAFEGRK